MARIDAASRRLLRARDAMDRSCATPLDVPALARIALTSEALFIRTFKQTFGETSHRDLQRRRLERAIGVSPVAAVVLVSMGWTIWGNVRGIREASGDNMGKRATRIAP